MSKWTGYGDVYFIISEHTFLGWKKIILQFYHVFNRSEIKRRWYIGFAKIEKRPHKYSRKW